VKNIIHTNIITFKEVHDPCDKHQTQPSTLVQTLQLANFEQFNAPLKAVDINSRPREAREKEKFD